MHDWVRGGLVAKRASTGAMVTCSRFESKAKRQEQKGQQLLGTMLHLVEAVEDGPMVHGVVADRLMENTAQSLAFLVAFVRVHIYFCKQQTRIYDYVSPPRRDA